LFDRRDGDHVLAAQLIAALGPPDLSDDEILARLLTLTQSVEQARPG
jgi:hypothetical protein